MNSDLRIFKLRVQALYNSWTQVALAAFVLGSLFAFTLDTYDVWVWFGGYFFGSCYFLVLTSLFAKKIKTTRDPKELKMFLEHWQTQSIFFASMWAALAILTANYGQTEKLLIGFAFAGVTAGNSISSATFPNIARIYSAIVLFTFMATNFYYQTEGYLPLNIMVGLYWILVSGVQQKLYDFFQNNFKMIVDLEKTQKKLKNSESKVA